MTYSQMSKGLAKGLRLKGLPTGTGLDLGAGSGQYTLLMAACKFLQVTALDSNSVRLTEIRRKLAIAGLQASIKCENLARENFVISPHSCAAICVGMTMYFPKSRIRTFFPMLWKALKPRGIFHVEFATYEDQSIQTDWVTMGMPDGDIPGSTWHYCTSPFCEYSAMGYLGGSFWEKAEALAYLKSLGSFRVIHKETFRWTDTVHDPVERPMKRCFHVITVQKL